MKAKLLSLFTFILVISASITYAGSSKADDQIPVTAYSLISRGQQICAIQETGSAKCWGTADFYQTDFSKYTEKLVQISEGYWGTSCAVTELGALKCVHVGESFPPPNDIGKVRQVAAGSGAACVIKYDFKVECWESGNHVYHEGVEPSDLGNVKQIVAGATHFCALTESGSVRCWGGDDSSQLQVPENIGTVTFLAGGREGTCAITENKKVVCWGRTYFSSTLRDLEDVHYVALDTSEEGRAGNVCASYGGLYQVRCEQNVAGVVENLNGTYSPAGQFSFGKDFLCVVPLGSGTVSCPKSYGGERYNDVPWGLGKVRPLSLTTKPQPLISITETGKPIGLKLGDWGSGISYWRGQWLRDGKDVSGVLEYFGDGDIFPYKPGILDLGSKISVRVSPVKYGYEIVMTESNKLTIRTIAVDNSPCGTGKKKTLSVTLDSKASKPVVTGKNYPGQSLSGSLGNWGKGTTTCSFWMVGEKSYPNVKNVSYKIQKADVGKEVRLFVVGAKGKISAIRISAPLVVRATGK